MLKGAKCKNVAQLVIRPEVPTHVPQAATVTLTWPAQARVVPHVVQPPKKQYFLIHWVYIENPMNLFIKETKLYRQFI